MAQSDNGRLFILPSGFSVRERGFVLSAVERNARAKLRVISVR